MKVMVRTTLKKVADAGGKLVSAHIGRAMAFPKCTSSYRPLSDLLVRMLMERPSPSTSLPRARAVASARLTQTLRSVQRTVDKAKARSPRPHHPSAASRSSLRSMTVLLRYEGYPNDRMLTSCTEDGAEDNITVKPGS